MTVEILLTDTTTAPAPALSDIFDTLQEAARSAAAQGHVLYGPQAKRALQVRYPDFTVRDFGYRKLVELLRAGHDAGRFVLVTVDGHPQVSPAPAAPVQRPVEQGRLRPDLWTTLVTWDPGLRYWDRRNRRAIFVPTDDNGAPRWESSASDFVEIDPVPQQQQLEWMVDFANDQSEAHQTALLASLKDPVRGAFKRALTDLGLSAAWRTRLRQKVTEHATEWAARTELAPASILEPVVRAVTKAPVTLPASPKTPTPTSSSSDLDQLRGRLHKVIDQMSLAELSQLQVPAAYLLER